MLKATLSDFLGRWVQVWSDLARQVRAWLPISVPIIKSAELKLGQCCPEKKSLVAVLGFKKLLDSLVVKLP